MGFANRWRSILCIWPFYKTSIIHYFKYCYKSLSVDPFPRVTFQNIAEPTGSLAKAREGTHLRFLFANSNLRILLHVFCSGSSKNVHSTSHSEVVQQHRAESVPAARQLSVEAGFLQAFLRAPCRSALRLLHSALSSGKNNITPFPSDRCSSLASG